MRLLIVVLPKKQIKLLKSLTVSLYRCAVHLVYTAARSAIFDNLPRFISLLSRAQQYESSIAPIANDRPDNANYQHRAKETQNNPKVV